MSEGPDVRGDESGAVAGDVPGAGERVDRTPADVLAGRSPDTIARFLVRGRLEGLPRRRSDRTAVLSWAATRLVPVHEPLPERELTDRLAAFVRDPVGIRRELVDAGLLTRTRDGAEYWRTHVTEFDSL